VRNINYQKIVQDKSWTPKDPFIYNAGRGLQLRPAPIFIHICIKNQLYVLNLMALTPALV